jgi:hypothetical protein
MNYQPLTTGNVLSHDHNPWHSISLSICIDQCFKHTHTTTWIVQELSDVLCKVFPQVLISGQKHVKFLQQCSLSGTADDDQCTGLEQQHQPTMSTTVSNYVPCILLHEIFIQIYLSTCHRHDVSGRYNHLYVFNQLFLSVS